MQPVRQHCDQHNLISRCTRSNFRTSSSCLWAFCLLVHSRLQQQEGVSPVGRSEFPLGNQSCLAPEGPHTNPSPPPIVKHQVGPEAQASAASDMTLGLLSGPNQRDSPCPSAPAPVTLVSWPTRMGLGRTGTYLFPKLKPYVFQDQGMSSFSTDHLYTYLYTR